MEAMAKSSPRGIKRLQLNYGFTKTHSNVFFFGLIRFCGHQIETLHDSCVQVETSPDGVARPMCCPAGSPSVVFRCMGCSLLALPSGPDVDVHVDGSVKYTGEERRYLYTTTIYDKTPFSSSYRWRLQYIERGGFFFVSTGGNLVPFFYFSFLFSGCSIFNFCLGVFFV